MTQKKGTAQGFQCRMTSCAEPGVAPIAWLPLKQLWHQQISNCARIHESHCKKGDQ